MSLIDIIPTVVPASLADITVAVEKYRGFARTLHVDFADGSFAPNSTWMPGPNTKIAGMELEAHLMVADPRALGLSCIGAGASRIIGHIEATKSDSIDVLDAWKHAGAHEAGLALLAQTSVESLDPYASACDFVMLMTITAIGVQGLPFDMSAPARVALMHARNPTLPIEVDGSVNETTIARLAPAGASRFCAGSVLSKAADPASTYAALLRLAGGVQ